MTMDNVQNPHLFQFIIRFSSCHFRLIVVIKLKINGGIDQERYWSLALVQRLNRSGSVHRH
jgi:hypothetical protein